MNWYKMQKMANMGEYWIDNSGSIMFADGDIGDFNHESLAIQHAQYQMMDGEEDFEAWKRKTALEILDEEKQELEQAKDEAEDQNNVDAVKMYDKRLYTIWEMSKNLDYYADDLIYKNLQKLYIDIETYKIANGEGDIRRFAQRKWGWKIVRNKSVETWVLTDKDLRIIANGLWEIFQDDVENLEFDIFITSNSSWYNDIPYSIISSGKVKELIDYRTMSQGTKIAKKT